MSAHAQQHGDGSAPLSARTGVAALRRADDHAAAALAARLELPVVDLRNASGGIYLLTITPDGLELREGGSAFALGLRVDFRSIDVRRGSRNLSRKQPLPRAIGRDTRSVVDATAGLCHDAFLLAAMGYDVTAVERHPVVAALVEDGLERAMSDPQIREAVDDRLRIVTADARCWLRSLPMAPDAVYLDPMFPPKRKASALSRKSVRMVRALVGDDPDAGELLAVALESGSRRVVLKRPDEARESLGKPALVFPARLVRYEVFFPPATSASMPVPGP